MMLSDEDRKEEALLNARISFEDVVDYPREGFQQRYCEVIDVVASQYGVSAIDLSGAWQRHILPGRIDFK